MSKELAWMRPKLAELCGLVQKFPDDPEKVYYTWFFNADVPYCHGMSWCPDEDVDQAVRCLEATQHTAAFNVRLALGRMWVCVIEDRMGPRSEKQNSQLPVAVCEAIADFFEWEKP